MVDQYSNYSVNGGELGQIDVSHVELTLKFIPKSELRETELK